ncbi:hypothetical protein C8R43DRAFT_960937 [Mycena crocata]|nr:hypothetical protein C8R43DRAFT_960937 [Mycena crocata]
MAASKCDGGQRDDVCCLNIESGVMGKYRLTPCSSSNLKTVGAGPYNQSKPRYQHTRNMSVRQAAQGLRQVEQKISASAEVQRIPRTAPAKSLPQCMDHMGKFTITDNLNWKSASSQRPCRLSLVVAKDVWSPGSLTYLVNPFPRGRGPLSMALIVTALGHSTELVQPTEPGDQRFASFFSVVGAILTYNGDGTRDNCRQGCLDAGGSPVKKFSTACQCKPASSTERRCAAGCVDDQGKRSVKYSKDCKCVDPRRFAGYRFASTGCGCQTTPCRHAAHLPTVDKRDRNAQAKIIARDLDRVPPLPPLPPINSLPTPEYIKIPFEMRKSRENAEKQAQKRSWKVRSEVARADLLSYVEPKYKSELTKVQLEIYAGGPTRVSFDKWCCPIHTAQSNGLFHPPALSWASISIRMVLGWPEIIAESLDYTLHLFYNHGSPLLYLNKTSRCLHMNAVEPAHMGTRSSGGNTIIHLQASANGTRSRERYQGCPEGLSISVVHRQIWCNAGDRNMIPLPMGSTLSAIEAPLLPRYVLRAVLLHHRWTESTLSLPWIPPEVPVDFYGPLWCQLLPGGQTFLVGKQTAVGMYDLRGQHGRQFDFEGTVVDLDWLHDENGASLTLGLLLITGIGSRTRRSLCLYEVDQSSFTVSPPRYLPLPIIRESCEGLTMMHSTALIWGENFIFILDLSKTASAGLHLHSRADNAPSLPLAVFLLSESSADHTRSLSLVENIVEYPPVADTPGDHGWETHALESRTLTTERLSEGVHRIRNFAGRAQFALVTQADTIVIVDIDRFSTPPMWSIQHPSHPRIPLGIIHNDDYFWPCTTQSGQLFLFIWRNDTLEFWKYTPQGIVQFSTLDPIAINFVRSYAEPSLVDIVLDTVHGRLLMLADGNALVLQY